IASIGVGLRGWVSYHGFALNVAPGPDAFAGIRPCGLHGVEMTSVRAEQGGTGEDPALLGRVRDVVAAQARRQLAADPSVG
ncbi:MAG: octanoyltransferase, partial [Myxococcales bacterium]|nr:octanoyltransferase [Myxococcales bacterium]